jgi:hypothetical protein
MPAISLGFGEVEERLQQIRRRLNSLSLQHAAYLAGTLIALLGALLVVVALRAPPDVFRACLAAYAVVVCAVAGVASFRLRARWLSLEGVARLADREATLESRLSTLCAQRSQPKRSRFGGILLAQTLALAPRWDRTTLAPRRVPRSVYLLLASFVLLGASWFAPPRQADSIAENDTSTTAPKDESETFNEHPAETSALPRPAPDESGAGIEGRGSGLAPIGESPALAGQHSAPGNIDGLPEPGQLGNREIGNLAGADPGQQRRSLGAAMDRSEESVEVRPPAGERRGSQRDTPDIDRRPSAHTGSAGGKDATRPDQRADQDPNRGQTNGTETARSKAQTESSTAKGGSKPSGKVDGGPVNDSLYEKGEAQVASQGEAGKAGTFALRLTGVAASAPASFEPQNQKPQEDGQGFGMGQSSSPQTGLAELQVEDDPLQKAQIAPEHESLLQRIFRHE